MPNNSSKLYQFALSPAVYESTRYPPFLPTWQAAVQCMSLPFYFAYFPRANLKHLKWVARPLVDKIWITWMILYKYTGFLGFPPPSPPPAVSKNKKLNIFHKFIVHLISSFRNCPCKPLAYFSTDFLLSLFSTERFFNSPIAKIFYIKLQEFFIDSDKSALSVTCISAHTFPPIT